MSLAPGTKLGPYEILTPIGAGGMGEVYRARDPRVGRDVAIKVSSEQFSDRFTREVHAVAALNHSNVCTLFDVGPNYLVMELVEGPTLADRIKQGPIPLEESLEIARQIADALEAAHEKGIVHRDLKPGNIKIRPDGTVKVLDFGLAKVEETAAVSLETSPTLSVAQTAAGVLLGTAAYMSPEQARGKPVDKRADIWAFGVVLYEMLTGKQLFSGETISDTLAATLKEAPDFEKVPSKVRPLLRSCLEKNPARRLRDIADAWRLLEERPDITPSERGRPWIAWIWAAIATLMVVILAVPVFRSLRDRQAAERMVFQIPVSRMPSDYGVAISPDGGSIAFVASLSGSVPSLFIRPIGSVTSKQLEGTEGAVYPFWSPDSRSIGFFAGGRLKVSEISGGLPRDLCVAGGSWGATWNGDGIILFTRWPVLQRVSATGGEPVAATKLDETKRELVHQYPSFLPDGRHYIYTAGSAISSQNAVYVGSLDSPEKTRLISGGISRAVYAEPGHILFLRDGGLFAQPFDAKKLALTGEAVRMADNMPFDILGRASFSASQNGILIYRSGAGLGKSQFMWFDRNGRLVGPAGAPAKFLTNFGLSPDGKRIVATENDDLWLIEWERNVNTRLTFDSNYNNNMAWSPDGLQIGFTTGRRGSFDIFVKKLNGDEEEKPLVESQDSKWMKDWSKDGRYICYTLGSQDTDLYAVPLFGDRKPFPVVRSPSSQDMPRFSYDGKWLAYDSNESGVWQVYIDSFPTGGRKRQISTTAAGGAQPHWRRDGKELYYLALDGKMMAVDITGETNLEPGTARVLFDTELNVDPVNDQFMVTPDGGRFLILKPLSEQASTPITVVLNWTSLLKK